MGMEFIYVLHFHQKLSHAQHYVGCTANLRKRLETHANGGGARLMEELMLQGMTWELGGIFSTCHANMRRLERSLKNARNSERYCQICNPIKQVSLPGTQKENINNVPFPRHSTELVNNHVDLAQVVELEPENEAEGMKFITNLMKKDKDALGFVPVGGVKGIKRLLAGRQIMIATENTEPCGYAFYTRSFNGELVNIHQACVADDARFKGHGEALVEAVAAKHPEARIIAKVRDDLAANHFWQAIGFKVELTKTHKTSGSTIHHYSRQAEKGQEDE